MRRRAKSWSLEGKLAGLLSALLLVAAAAGAALEKALHDAVLATLSVFTVGVLILVWLARRIMRPIRKLLRAVSGAVGSYRDGDFSLSLVVDREDELGALQSAHNELGRALREQRANIVQRELLLETVTQHSPVALVLVDVYQRVVYSNLAARHLLRNGRSLVGLDFTRLLHEVPEAVRAAISGNQDCLFSVDLDGSEETFHLSRQSFMLQGIRHKLYLLKRITREISRQEIGTCKKVIRVLSHEINNSLAPISSLAKSGAEVARRGQTGELDEIFAAIGERADHLDQFIQGYAAFAKLPTPRPEWVEWSDLIDEVILQEHCRVVGDLPVERGWFDRSQISRALVNLLKNAYEAHGAAAEAELAVFDSNTEHHVEVRDRGPGMSDEVMSQALLPFYSTKRDGTGLGLALVREITEAHGGHVRLSNRDNGGLCVALILPRRRLQ
jgi:two-component system nitrogen regulation sensor histidine kinase NtrY